VTRKPDKDHAQSSSRTLSATRPCIKAPSAIAGPDAVPGATADTPKDNQYSRAYPRRRQEPPRCIPTSASGRGQLFHRTGTSVHDLARRGTTPKG
jgi:hypothetical protein